MEHQWEAVIDSPQEGHCLRSTSRSALINCPGIQLKGQQVLHVCVCVCVQESSRKKRPTLEKVGCLVYSVWAANYFLFWYVWKACVSFQSPGLGCER